jgi:hypothetical protein
MAFAFDETSCDGSQIANASEVDVEVGREENELLVHHGQERLPFDDTVAFFATNLLRLRRFCRLANCRRRPTRRVRNG